jgi:hypothetical protein
VALISNIGAAPLTKEDRKRIAVHLYGKDWTMERIAEALRVGVGTVHRDLADFSTVEKSMRAKSAINPKGAGRPKKQRPHKNPVVKEVTAAALVLDQGRTYEQAAREAGIDGSRCQLSAALVGGRGKTRGLRLNALAWP